MDSLPTVYYAHTRADSVLAPDLDMTAYNTRSFCLFLVITDIYANSVLECEQILTCAGSHSLRTRQWGIK